MNNAERFPVIATDAALGAASLSPYLPLSLSHEDRIIEVSGLLDTGASVNVMRFSIGLDLGADWDQLTTSLDLTGNLAQYEARALMVTCVVRGFEPVRLVFAWTKATEVPMIIGQVNFFMEFDICFYRSQLTFDIRAKSIP